MTTRNSFDGLKRKYEAAYLSGGGYEVELQELGKACALSVLKKLCDPQKNSGRGGGYNPAIEELRRGALEGAALLRNTSTAAGDLFILQKEALHEGYDIISEAQLAILEESKKHSGGGEGFLDKAFTEKRLSKRVYIQAKTSAAYKEVNTTPIQEVYRRIRGYIINNRSVKIDPRNGYTYIEDVEGGIDGVYFRAGKYADIGGYDINGNYTAAAGIVKDTEELVKACSFTARELEVLKLRYAGRGYKAISTYLGISNNAVVKIVKNMQKKAAAAGIFNPSKEE